MAKKELPQHIKEFYEKDEKVRKLLNTTHAVHTKAYLKGLEVITDKNGEVDYQKLEDEDTQDKFLKKMVDYYLDSAVHTLGLKDRPKSEIEEEMFLLKYTGITKGHLKRMLRESKSKYTLKAHENVRDGLIKKQTEELEPLRITHLEKKHIGDILQHVGIKDYLDKDRIQLGHAAHLLDLYKEKGEFSLSDLKHLTSASEKEGGWGSDSDIYLTEKGKKGIKELKEKYKRAA